MIKHYLVEAFDIEPNKSITTRNNCIILNITVLDPLGFIAT